MITLKENLIGHANIGPRYVWLTSEIKLLIEHYFHCLLYIVSKYCMFYFLMEDLLLYLISCK